VLGVQSNVRVARVVRRVRSVRVWMQPFTTRIFGGLSGDEEYRYLAKAVTSLRLEP